MPSTSISVTSSPSAVRPRLAGRTCPLDHVEFDDLLALEGQARVVGQHDLEVDALALQLVGEAGRGGGEPAGADEWSGLSGGEQRC